MPRGVPKINEMVTVPKGGRPPGSKNKDTPQAFRKGFLNKTRTQLHKLVDAGDKDTVLALTKLFYKDLPPPAVTLCKVKDSSDAVRSLSQPIELTASGLIDGQQADRLERQITKYLEITEVAQLRERLDALEEARKDEV